MNPLDIIEKFYATTPELHSLLLLHSRQVADLALKCNDRHPELKMDRDLILRGALLHDIGIIHTNAPSISCFGGEHYLMHGFIGAKMLREIGMEAEARICECHTGAGLDKKTVIEKDLDVEPKDYFPQTLEEQVVCYADKFYSKSKPECTLTPQQVYEDLLRFGKDGAERFRQWQAMFGDGTLI